MMHAYMDESGIITAEWQGGNPPGALVSDGGYWYPLEETREPFDPATQRQHKVVTLLPDKILYDWKSVDIPPEELVPPVPITVTQAQARVALSRAGLLPLVESALASLQGQTGDEARIVWNFAPSIHRDHPMVVVMGAQLGLTVEALDKLFQSASEL